MKMDIVAWSGNDEFFTPQYAVLPILKYLKPNSIIWCPFDLQMSNFVQMLIKEWHTVYNSHISQWQDFFTIAPPQWTQYIISNPPYSKKTEVFQRLFELWIPFAMLVGVVWLFESQIRFDMFRQNDFEIMYINRRISYFKNYEEQKPSLNPPFSSVYLCSKILPEKIVFEDINKCVPTT